MPFIQNVSLDDVRKGHHIAVNPKTILIQIVDTDMDFPKPLYNFAEVYQFKFLDVEDEEHYQCAITDQQASDLATILLEAYKSNKDVIVHCVAGICRSGAVVEVGTMLGFQDPEIYRCPNLLVKSKLMKQLGWSYE